MKILKKLGIVLLLVLIVMQFFGPEKNIGDVNDLTAFYTETNPNAEVKAILDKACLDCHSSNTKYPWYSNISPVSLWMNNHIKHGKEELNFSEWSSYSLKKKKHKMEEVIEEVKEKHMPIGSYLWTHTDAKLTDAEIDVLDKWVQHTLDIYNTLATQSE